LPVALDAGAYHVSAIGRGLRAGSGSEREIPAELADLLLSGESRYRRTERAAGPEPGTYARSAIAVVEVLLAEGNLRMDVRQALATPHAPSQGALPEVLGQGTLSNRAAAIGADSATAIG